MEKNHFGPWDAQICEVAPALAATTTVFLSIGEVYAIMSDVSVLANYLLNTCPIYVACSEIKTGIRECEIKQRG